MTPANALSQVLKISPNTARLIYGGLGILAAAALALGWGDMEKLLPVGIIIMILGVIATLLAFVFTQPMMKLVLGWAFVGLTIVFLLLGLDAMTRMAGIAPPLPCWKTMLSETREICEARLRTTTTVVAEAPVSDVIRPPSAADRSNSGIAIAARPAPPSSIRPAPNVAAPAPVIELAERDNPVFLHFTGATEAASAETIASTLDDFGWTMEGDGGGQMVKAGPSSTQIRFFQPEHSEAAFDLAQDLSDILGGDVVDVEDLSQLGYSARDGLLEIWLGPSV
ncbi:MAG: hypothetical protein AAGF13_01840 [Pseudomonadota bacterium]